MNYRTLGKSRIKVSEIGFGAWGIGKSMWIGAEDDESLRSLKAARDAGVNFFDTALAYGDGHSEQLISRAFGRSPEVVIASKVPPKNLIWSVAAGSSLRDTFPKEYVIASLDRTLKNLDRESRRYLSISHLDRRLGPRAGVAGDRTRNKAIGQGKANRYLDTESLAGKCHPGA